MALDDDIRVLSGVRLFEGFTREQLRLIAFGAETISLHAGRKLYSEGAPADCAFVVASGEVALFHQAEGGREVAVLRGHGDMVTSVAFSADGQRLATVREEHIGVDSWRQALVTMSLTGTEERMEFAFPTYISGSTYYGSGFSWQPR
jgi:WD40 repeat protein